MKISQTVQVFGNFRKCSEIFGKQFKAVFQAFLCFFENFGKSSEVFGNLEKFSETVQSCFS